MSTIPQDFKAMRTAMVEDLTAKLFGPTDPTDAAPIRLNPLQLYATGVLFPQRIPVVGLEEDANEEDSSAPLIDGDISNATGVRSRGTETERTERSSDNTEPLNLANEFSPAAMGLTFKVPAGTPLKCRVRAATYRSEPDPDISSRPRYVREPIDELIPIETTEIGVLKPIPVATRRGELSLEIVIRDKGSSVVVSAMLVNKKTRGERSAKFDLCFFQVGIEVRAEDGSTIFEPIDRKDGGIRDDELDQLELLYRHRQSFALGHGVASDWSRAEGFALKGRCDMICTAALPQYEIEPVEPRSKFYQDSSAFDLSMGFLYSGGQSSDPEAEILNMLSSLANDYAV